ncbi:ExbD/TolR family protein [Pontiella agarivorans]|uniref:Biopolymer transporter ExbD n=1 Tax=Pontiella agarivorans TaxID=3038953 RepID=A0ABU5MZW0_9BACT|nr:biopolymer transporter ExbD [Pontiella agarivorans]MDZ8119755.1 biopolymer transporter ExbD [Pontiella agarivorans]
MKPFDPHKKSQQLRNFKPTRKPAGVFTIALGFCDSSLLALAFFLVVSPFVMQPGINITLPESPFSGGARFGSMVLSITRGEWYFFNNERLDEAGLREALRAAALLHRDSVLIIEADEHVSHGAVVKAWNAALEAGISEVSIATRISAVEEGEP